MSQEKDRLLRVNVAAERLGYSDRHVRRLIKEGRLEKVEESPRRRFVPESAVEAFRHREE